MQTTEIVNLRLPKEHIEWLDTLVRNGTFKTRSEALREFSRSYLEDLKS